MPDMAVIGMRDYSREIGHSNINIVDITAGNLAAQQALLTTLGTEVLDVTRGILAEVEIQAITPGTSILPTLEEAQIEKTWLILYVDTQAFLDPGPDTVPNPGWGKTFQAHLPTAVYTDHLLPASDFADLAETDIAAFVAAFEALVVSPYGGTIEVQSIQVGAAR